MKGLQSKINKLTKALETKEKVVFINSSQNYSVEAKKTFTFYSVVITDEKSIEYRRGLRAEKNRLKKTIELTEENKIECDSDEEREKLKAKIKSLENQLRGVNTELKFSAPPRWEFNSKIEILLLLVEVYKKVLGSGVE
ncbi:MAG: hypothetical protein ACRC5G_03245 [Cetobacterium sp.]